MKKRHVIIICGCIIGFIILALIPKNAANVINAVVNPNNGDVAFCYFDTSGRLEALRISMFDKDGNKLFSKAFYTSGGACMVFDDDELCIALAREDKKYSFDRNGEDVKNPISIEQIREDMFFTDWEYSFGEFTYSLDGYTYFYADPTIFSRKAILKINDGEKDIVIYESPKSD